MTLNRRSWPLLLSMLLPGMAIAAGLFPPGTTYVLPPNDPDTTRIEDIPLWPGSAPGSQRVKIQETVEESTFNPSRAVRGVSTPAVQAFVAAKPRGVAVLVMPGGGYRSIVWDKEGVEVARWLNGLGIDAYVLKYRLPDEGHENGRFVPLQDAQRAMRLIRARHPTAKIGALGFSAGGHLAGMIGTTYATHYYDAIDRTDALSSRPDFMVLIYAPTGGGGASFLASEREQLVAKHSVLTGIDSASPPTFLVHGAADSRVPAQNAADISRLCKNLAWHRNCTSFLARSTASHCAAPDPRRSGRCCAPRGSKKSGCCRQLPHAETSPLLPMRAKARGELRSRGPESCRRSFLPEAAWPSPAVPERHLTDDRR